MKLLISLLLATTMIGCGDSGTTETQATDDSPPILGSKADEAVTADPMERDDDDDWFGDDDWFDDEDRADDETASDATSEDPGDVSWEGGDDVAGPEDTMTGGEGDGEALEADPWAPARDVNLHKVVFDESLKADTYQYPSTGTGFNLSGTEFWQKWPGGENPTYSFSVGTDYGRRCMLASAKRFEAIMSDPPQELKDLKLSSNWSGSFFNWNDDYSLSDWGDGSSARLWAWRTTLIKWISQTSKDGSCYLPTLDMVMSLTASCQSKANSSNGEIVGCKAP